MLYPLSYERTAYEYTAAGRLLVRVDATFPGRDAASPERMCPIERRDKADKTAHLSTFNL